MVPYDENHTFGKSLAPGPPMKDLLSNYFATITDHLTMTRYDSISHLPMRTLSSHKRDTRASSLSKNHVLENTSKPINLLQNPLDLYKMNRFKQVAPRTDTNLRRRKTDIPPIPKPSRNIN